MKAIDRLYEYFDNQNIKPTVFEREAGLSSGYLSVQKKRNADLGETILNKINDYCHSLSIEWLLTGSGDMLKKEANNIEHLNTQTSSSDDDSSGVSIYKLKTDYYGVERQLIPLYEIDAAAGLSVLFTNQAAQIPLDYITVPNAPKCDGAVSVRGDSMYPILKAGDIICYKTITNIDNIVYGEMYLLDIDNGDDQYLTVKFVQKSEKGDKYVTLASENRYHASKDIAVSQIRALAIIKLSIRYNTIS